MAFVDNMFSFSLPSFTFFLPTQEAVSVTPFVTDQILSFHQAKPHLKTVFVTVFLLKRKKERKTKRNFPNIRASHATRRRRVEDKQNFSIFRARKEFPSSPTTSPSLAFSARRTFNDLKL